MEFGRREVDEWGLCVSAFFRDVLFLSSMLDARDRIDDGLFVDRLARSRSR